MISWMQRHRKWLVITIWVASIAFVGAGFVGWGSYDFNLNRTSSVAKVGGEKVGFMEFNRRFSQLFSYYQQVSNGTLTEQQAREQGLDAVALQTLIDDKLLINFAKELGIGASEDEIISILITDKEFADASGNFDKEIYYRLLSQNGIDAKDYEQMLSDSIVLIKLNSLFNLPVREKELEMLASNFFMQDVLSVQLVRADKNDNAKVDEKALKELWEKYKEEFKTQKSYEISTYFLPTKKLANVDKKALQEFYEKNKQNYKDFSGKILAFEDVANEVEDNYALEAIKTEANKAYLALSKKELEFQGDLSIDDNDVYYPIELLKSGKAGLVLKPFVFEQDGQNGYMIVRINAINSARTKSFEEARAEILPLYRLNEQKQALEQKASKALLNFKGKNIGSVSRDTKRSSDKIDDKMMNDGEFAFFLMNVFNSAESKGFVLFDDKAVLYSISGQNLISTNKLNAYKDKLAQDVRTIKANEIKKELLARLKGRYKVEIYYEKDKS